LDHSKLKQKKNWNVARDTVQSCLRDPVTF
jgi:hypothetical protein